MNLELQALSSPDYEYLDAGAGGRLERFGPYVLDRPSPVALWAREHPELWPRAAGVYHRSSSGGGHWSFRARLPQTWPLRWNQFTFEIKPTGFGHMGFFPEHTGHWPWVAEQVARRPGCRVLNLFAYTGALTLLCAGAGAEVCHVDAVREINEWARRNAAASGLSGAPVRWITDDVLKFTARELRRGRRYEALIADPPSYGKGPQGEKWILEEQILRLLEQLLALTSDQPRFVLFTSHTPGFSPPLLRNLLRPWQDRFGGEIEAGTMTLASANCRCVLPSGCFARWRAEKTSRARAAEAAPAARAAQGRRTAEPAP